MSATDFSFLDRTFTRRGVLAATAAGLTSLSGNWVDLQNPCKEPPRELRTADGELFLAWERSAKKTSVVHLHKWKTEQGYRSEVLFSEDAYPLLRIKSHMLRKREERSLGQVTTTFEAMDFLYRFSMNATNILLDEIADRRPPEGKVSVEIFYKNEVSDGSFDFTTWKGSGLSADEVLPKTIREKIEVLSSSLNGMVEYYKSQSNGAFSPEPGHPMAASAWKGKLCRAACWGVAGAASAFCCAGTAGIACILCAGAEAALASMCSDSCPT